MAGLPSIACFLVARRVLVLGFVFRIGLPSFVVVLTCLPRAFLPGIGILIIILALLIPPALSLGRFPYGPIFTRRQTRIYSHSSDDSFPYAAYGEHGPFPKPYLVTLYPVHRPLPALPQKSRTTADLPPP